VLDAVQVLFREDFAAQIGRLATMQRGEKHSNETRSGRVVITAFQMQSSEITSPKETYFIPVVTIYII